MAVIHSKHAKEGDVEINKKSVGAVYRVHDHTSYAQFGHSGFVTYTEGSGAGQQGVKWKQIYEKVMDDLQDGSDGVKLDLWASVMRHVAGGWGAAGAVKTSTLPVGQLGWISTTQSFDWAVYEIARRLLVVHTDVVYLTKVSCALHSPRYEGNRAIWVDAVDAIEACGPNSPGAGGARKAYNFAMASSERVFLGKIPRGDIKSTQKWTLKVCPFHTGYKAEQMLVNQNIPYSMKHPAVEGLFKAKKHRSGATWVDKLVFDPRIHTYYQAMEKIKDRREQLRRSRC